LPVAATVTLTVNSLPVSCETTALTPAALLVILGWPEKPVPEMVKVTVLPTTAEPWTAPTWNAGAGGAVATNTAADVAEPPSTLVTESVTGVALAAPKVQEVVIEVALTTSAAPQVPSEEAATVAPVWKPVPVMVKAVVALAAPVAGDTDVMVGPAPMMRAERPAGTLATPPSVFVTL